MQKDGVYAGCQSVDFGADISVGEDELHLDECVFKQSYSFLYFRVASGIWIYCEAQVFKGVYLFYSFPFAKIVTYRNVWLFWDDHALSLLSIELKSFVFTFDLNVLKTTKYNKAKAEPCYVSYWMKSTLLSKHFLTWMQPVVKVGSICTFFLALLKWLFAAETIP